MHWADEVAGKLVERGGSHVIETGTSISGIPHVGNASDIIRGDAVRKALSEEGADVRLIWVSDDSDPFRKVPAGMEALKDYLGFPVKDIPDPQGCHKGFVEHFAEPFIESLSKFGVTPEVYSGTSLYREGKLLPQIKKAFEEREKIREILNKFRQEPLPPDFVPWTPICSKCGRISTTKINQVDGLKVHYTCQDSDVSGGSVKGCGHKGISHADKGEGKLPWRVEWAARWSHFNVTCEPFGKDHAAPGGSYDTSKLISKEVFGWVPPEPVVYEFFTLNGAKISSSAGNVITPADWIEIAEPEVLKFFMYKRLLKQRDIDLTKIPNITDEYDNAEAAFFGKNSVPEEEGELPSRTYALSQINEPKPLGVPYTVCAVLAQILPEGNKDLAVKRVKEMGYKEFDEELLMRRIKAASHWVARFCPEHLKFTLLTEKPAVELTALQVKGLHALAEALNENWTPETLHKKIYETARGAGLQPTELFTAIYRALIGKDKGPKAAAFLLSLDRGFVRERFLSF
ncbi:Lysine--tRNA ligase [uncultured archaeon]|nr:Lysine--tRNA ligase [uncultured archaeon]